jgi:hypothetical protein
MTQNQKHRYVPIMRSRESRQLLLLLLLETWPVTGTVHRRRLMSRNSNRWQILVFTIIDLCTCAAAVTKRAGSVPITLSSRSAHGGQLLTEDPRCA